jgi:hypothetical protein
MMHFCKLLSDKMPLAKFLFISPHLHDVIASAAVKYGLSADKLIVKHGKRHEIPALLSLSDSLFFYQTLLFEDLFFSYKTWRNNGDGDTGYYQSWGW